MDELQETLPPFGLFSREGQGEVSFPEVEKPRGLEREDARVGQDEGGARRVSEQRVQSEKARLLEPTQCVRGIAKDGEERSSEVLASISNANLTKANTDRWLVAKLNKPPSFDGYRVAKPELSVYVVGFGIRAKR